MLRGPGSLQTHDLPDPDFRVLYLDTQVTIPGNLLLIFSHQFHPDAFWHSTLTPTLPFNLFPSFFLPSTLQQLSVPFPRPCPQSNIQSVLATKDCCMGMRMEEKPQDCSTHFVSIKNKHQPTLHRTQNHLLYSLKYACPILVLRLFEIYLHFKFSVMYFVSV